MSYVQERWPVIELAESVVGAVRFTIRIHADYSCTGLEAFVKALALVDREGEAALEALKNSTVTLDLLWKPKGTPDWRAATIRSTSHGRIVGGDRVIGVPLDQSVVLEWDYRADGGRPGGYLDYVAHVSDEQSPG